MFDQSNSDSEFTPEGYITFWRDRNISDYSTNIYSKHDWGGDLFLVRSSLWPQQCMTDAEAEIWWIKINVENKESLLLGAAYRPGQDKIKNP